MDEEISIIDTSTRNEKIRNFFINNKKNILLVIIIIIFLLIGYFLYGEIKKRGNIKIANEYNSTLIDYDLVDKSKTVGQLTDLVNKKNKTYSPLALYFLIDNNLIKDKEKINILFDVLIEKTNLETEIKNLVIYKKTLYNSNDLNEIELIKTLDPSINSKSIWKSHALYLIAEYFYSRDEKNKAKEFFLQIQFVENANSEIKLEAKKRLNRDFSE